MSLPFLPGLSLNPTSARPRRQFFSRDDGVTAEKAGGGATKGPKRASAFGATRANGTMPGAMATNGGAAGGESVPAWLAFAGQALRFTAYFQESVTESASEHFKVRRVIIVYHLEDDSVSVVEPAVSNAGAPSGVLLRRHRIALPNDPDDFYMPDDFYIGAEVEFYGRKYRIIDSDDFTRTFYRRSGVELGEKEDYPEDQHSRAMERREREKRRVTAPKPEVDAKAQFLLHDKDVLEFFCKWDEKRMFAEARKFRLQYFLADDQIQVVEVYKPNSGRDQSGPFLRKQRLRKPDGADAPGRGGGAGSITTSGTGDPTAAPVPHYHWTDLRVGERIDVLGRPFLIYDCDERTKRFYLERLKIAFQPLQLHEPAKREYAVADPPYNGWGSEEDSLLSSKSLIPNPPRQDVAKLLKNDRQVTRFAAKLVSRVVEDTERDFVVTFHLMDDTITIYEPAKRNSGMVSGKFLERQRIKKGPAARGASLPEYYSAADMYVGARVTANAHTFVLLETDEFSLGVMESRPAEFPRSDLQLIHLKLRAFLSGGGGGGRGGNSDRDGFLRTLFAEHDADRSGQLSMTEFALALRSLPPTADLSDQEIIHLMRHYDTNGDGQISYEELAAVLECPDDSAVPVNPAARARAELEAQPVAITPEVVRDSVRDAIRALDEALRARRGQLLASFREFDRDGDSRLSLDECVAFGGCFFCLFVCLFVCFGVGFCFFLIFFLSFFFCFLSPTTHFSILKKSNKKNPSLHRFRGMLRGVNLALSPEQKDQLVNHFFGDAEVGGPTGRMGFQRFLVLLQREPTAETVLRGVSAF
jgi:Ca2+-binding EF-hand superfamily protein